MTWYKADTNRRRTGLVVGLYPHPDHPDASIEVQRAPDDGSGAADSANATTITIANPGVTKVVDLLPLDGANRFYRTRHVQENATSSGWTNWTDGQIPTYLPDPLPPVPSLVPDIDVVVTPSAGSYSIVATASLGELEYGVVEFQDPEWTDTGNITSGATTLSGLTAITVSDVMTNMKVVVAGAGASGADLETYVSAIIGVSALTTGNAAGTTVSGAATTIGGGWHDDFDNDGTAESQETNTRNRPESDEESSWIMFRAKANGQVSSPTYVVIPSKPAPYIDGVSATCNDDGSDLDWSVTWTAQGGATSADYDISIEYFLDGVLVDSQDGVSLDATQPYTHSSTGEGGTGGGGECWVIVYLVSDPGNTDVFAATSRRDFVTT